MLLLLTYDILIYILSYPFLYPSFPQSFQCVCVVGGCCLQISGISQIRNYIQSANMTYYHERRTGVLILKLQTNIQMYGSIYMGGGVVTIFLSEECGVVGRTLDWQPRTLLLLEVALLICLVQSSGFLNRSSSPNSKAKGLPIF